MKNELLEIIKKVINANPDNKHIFYKAYEEGWINKKEYEMVEEFLNEGN